MNVLFNQKKYYTFSTIQLPKLNKYYDQVHWTKIIKNEIISYLTPISLAY